MVEDSIHVVIYTSFVPKLRTKFFPIFETTSVSVSALAITLNFLFQAATLATPSRPLRRIAARDVV